MDFQSSASGVRSRDEVQVIRQLATSFHCHDISRRWLLNLCIGRHGGKLHAPGRTPECQGDRRWKRSSSEIARTFLGISVTWLVLILSTSPTLGAQSRVASKGSEGSTSRYGSEFFAGKNPLTAFDMVNLLPGFTFSAGDTTLRGYAAAAGNVLIDGQRVSNKQFTLSNVLQHIPAGEVDHIEVIEGGAPGVEMLGQSIVANVIRKRQTGNKVVLTLSNAMFDDGRNAPGGTLELSHHWSGGRSLSSAVSASKYVELAEGNGPQVTRDPQGGVLKQASVTSAAGGLNAYGYGTYSSPAWRGILAINGSSSRTDYTYREHDDTTFPGPSSSDLHEHLGGPLGGQLQNELR